MLPDVVSDSSSDLPAIEAEFEYEDIVQDQGTLNIVNQNYRNRFVYQCRDFALACCDKIPEKPVRIPHNICSEIS